MMTNKFVSNYSKSLERFLEFRKTSLDIQSDTAKSSLVKFDRFAFKTGIRSPGLSKTILDRFNESIKIESSHTRYFRILYLAAFSKFLNLSGIVSYVPALPKKPRCTFVPYIYTDEEIDSIYKAFDNFKLSARRSDSIVFLSAALIRTLRATGMRYGEARNLGDEDIDLNNHLIHIRKSKNGKERTIPIHDSLVIVLKEYLLRRTELPVPEGRKIKFFFGKPNGQKLAKNGFYEHFRKCLAKANIKRNPNGIGPRIHDLRHTFAVKSYAQMILDGVQFEVAVINLCNYMGHKNLESLNYYLRLALELYPNLLNKLKEMGDDIYPNIPDEEY